MTKIKEFIHSERGRTVGLILLFSCYLIVLMWGLIFKCNIEGELNIERNQSMTLWERLTYRVIPFQEAYYAFAYKRFWSILAVFFNVILLIPCGLILRFWCRERTALLLALALSLGVETFQLFSGWGGPDPTDLFLNVLGAYIGSKIFNPLYTRLPMQKVNALIYAILLPSIPCTVFVIVQTIVRFPV